MQYKLCKYIYGTSLLINGMASILKIVPKFFVTFFFTKTTHLIPNARLDFSDSNLNECLFDTSASCGHSFV